MRGGEGEGKGEEGRRQGRGKRGEGGGERVEERRRGEERRYGRVGRDTKDLGISSRKCSEGKGLVILISNTGRSLPPTFQLVYLTVNQYHGTRPMPSQLKSKVFIV